MKLSPTAFERKAIYNNYKAMHFQQLKAMLLRILVDRPEALSPPIFHSMEWQSVATVLPAGLPRRPSIATLPPKRFNKSTAS